MDRSPKALLDALEAFAATSLRREFDLAWLRSLRQQAEFGYRRLNADAYSLGARAKLLEIGGGPYLLSMLFAANGFNVVALEPRGLGFEQLHRIQDAVLSFCERERITFRVLDRKIEDFNERDAFDLAYSVNVFEHIDNVAAGLRNGVSALRQNGALRILCANYNFPYEPHFGIPIVFDKRTTKVLFARRIANRELSGMSEGLWESLNFISVRMLRGLCVRQGWDIAFDPSTTVDILERFQFDQCLRQRHAPLVPVVNVALKFGVRRLLAGLPAVLHPYMDARITKRRQGAN